MTTTCSPLDRFRDHGLLVIRLGLGLMFLFVHGGPKMLAGTATWVKLGEAMGPLALGVPVFWGFMAAFAESVGALFIMTGLFFRPAILMLVVTMAVAAAKHLGIPADQPGGGLKGASHAIEVGIVFLGLLFTGPGRFAIPCPLCRFVGSRLFGASCPSPGASEKAK